jgi:deferrochelatase/peroxidase EfeB
VSDDRRFRLSRRQFFGSTALASLGAISVAAIDPASAADASTQQASESFYGDHQGGIATAAQDHLVFATFDVETQSPSVLRSTLDSWSQASADMAAGRDLPGGYALSSPPSDTGEAMGIGPARLTITLGLGTAFFTAPAAASSQRPSRLVDLPAFPGDQIDGSTSGGALCVQACSDDPQVAFHAIHNLARLGLGSLVLRNVQVGFGRTSSTTSAQTTPRNLLGFKDGTNNLLADEPGAFEEHVWVSSGDPAWMRGGTFLVARRIRTRLEEWASSSLGTQQDAIGRVKGSGAPLGATREHDKVDLAAVGPHGQPIIPEGAHIRLASATQNGGVRILRRGYGFADGVDPVTGELDAGLFFISFQKDPIEQFAAIQHQLSLADSLHQYLVHTSSGVYACPRGLSPSEGWGSQILG